ncbi:uncharacterized protein [Oscarella lobularis]|uniref:uncharacterized protein isoform X2 n=1 Tax=Oscarella lobularis TaxID=121494 RepID=UPI003313D4F4
MTKPTPIHNVDVCVLTAVDVENKEAKRALEKVCGAPPFSGRVADSKGSLLRDCLVFEWQPHDTSKKLKLALFQQSSMGSAEAALLVHDVSTLKPVLMAMVGVCAGAPDKVEAGDVLTPYEVQVAWGKVTGDGEIEHDPKLAPLGNKIKRIVSGAKSATVDEYEWKRFMPDSKQPVPPNDLQDAILRAVRAKGDDAKATSSEIFQWLEDADEVQKEWVEQAVQRMIELGHLKNVDKRRGEDVVALAKEGKEYFQREVPEKARKIRLPKVHTDPVLTINQVNVSIKFSDVRKTVASRKLIGVEMEGYYFLFHAAHEENHAVFIKAASDFGTERSKLKYYQKYCASSATAYLCYLISNNPQLFGGCEEKPISTPASQAPTGRHGYLQAIENFPAGDEEMNLKKERYKQLKLAIAKVAQIKWKEIGQELLSQDQVVEIEKIQSNFSRLAAVIETWILGTDKPLVKILLGACENQGVIKKRIEEDYSSRMEMI